MRLIVPRCGSPVRGSVMYFFQFICFDFNSGAVYLSRNDYHQKIERHRGQVPRIA